MLSYECLTKLDNCEAGVYLLIMSWMTELDDTKSCYQLIKTMTKSEKDSHKKQLTVNLAKCVTTVHTHDTYCLFTQV